MESNISYLEKAELFLRLKDENGDYFLSSESKQAVRYFAQWLGGHNDRCPNCDGRGWFGEQFCEGEECITCEGTGKRKT